MTGRPPSPPQDAAAVAAVCGACGARFGCGIETGGCWCAGVDTSPDALAALAARFDGCLCPSCLRRLAAAHEQAAAG